MIKQACESWKKVVGKAGGLKLCVVDGKHVRSCIGDVDFALGGNSERYPYIPDDEVWAENSKDLYETFGHEIIERALMKKGGDYEKSHKIALAWEMATRGVKTMAEHQEVDKRALAKRACLIWLSKQAEPTGHAFDSRTTPDMDTQGSVIDPEPAKRHQHPQFDNATTSDEDDKDIKEPLSRACSDGGGGEGPV